MAFPFPFAKVFDLPQYLTALLHSLVASKLLHLCVDIKLVKVPLKCLRRKLCSDMLNPLVLPVAKQFNRLEKPSLFQIM